MLAAALAAATSVSAQVSFSDGNAGDWNIWSPNPAPNGSYGGSATVTTEAVGGPNGGGYSIIPNVYPGQDGGAYTFFGQGNSATPALASSAFSQSIAVYLNPSTEVGYLEIDETPGSTVPQNDGSGDYSYSLWSAENGFNFTGNGTSITISSEDNLAIGTITTAGWYDFNLGFSTTGETLSVSGVGSVTSSIVPGSDLAGSGYLWFTEWGGDFTDPGTLDVADLDATPVPEPTTIISGVLMLLPFGSSAFRQLRKKLQTA